MDKKIEKQILEIWHLMEMPMTVFRSSKLSLGREQSIAEHAWRISLLALVIGPQLEQKINIERAIKLALVHDLGEMKKGDVPLTEHGFNLEIKEQKEIDEKATMEELYANYPVPTKEILALWEEFESQETPESKFVKALDKLDGRISIIDDPETKSFTEERKQKGSILSLKVDEYCKYDPVLKEIALLSREERQKKWGF